MILRAPGIHLLCQLVGDLEAREITVCWALFTPFSPIHTDPNPSGPSHRSELSILHDMEASLCYLKTHQSDKGEKMQAYQVHSLRWLL